jgi:hypothetical protein
MGSLATRADAAREMAAERGHLLFSDLSQAPNYWRHGSEGDLRDARFTLDSIDRYFYSIGRQFHVAAGIDMIADPMVRYLYVNSVGNLKSIHSVVLHRQQRNKTMQPGSSSPEEYDLRDPTDLQVSWYGLGGDTIAGCISQNLVDLRSDGDGGANELLQVVLALLLKKDMLPEWTINREEFNPANPDMYPPKHTNKLGACKGFAEADNPENNLVFGWIPKMLPISLGEFVPVDVSTDKTFDYHVNRSWHEKVLPRGFECWYKAMHHLKVNNEGQSCDSDDSIIFRPSKHDFDFKDTEDAKVHDAYHDTDNIFTAAGWVNTTVTAEVWDRIKQKANIGIDSWYTSQELEIARNPEAGNREHDVGASAAGSTEGNTLGASTRRVRAARSESDAEEKCKTVPVAETLAATMAVANARTRRYTNHPRPFAGDSGGEPDSKKLKSCERRKK